MTALDSCPNRAGSWFRNDPSVLGVTGLQLFDGGSWCPNAGRAGEPFVTAEAEGPVEPEVDLPDHAVDVQEKVLAPRFSTFRELAV